MALTETPRRFWSRSTDRRGAAAGASTRRRGIGASAGCGLALAGGLIAIAFATSGGNTLAPNTWTEIVLVAVGSAVAIAVLVAGKPGPAWGQVSLLTFAALAAMTGASVAWSVQPDSSWIEAGRTVSYLAAFGAAIGLARIGPERWSSVVGGVAVAATVIAAYALLVKVFPATFDASDTFGRLRAPFDYWNATGLIGAMGLPPCLWAGARRGGARAMRALAVPATTILLSVVVLSFSRGALLVAVVGLVVWFSFVPLRLRGAIVLLAGAAGAVAISAFALGTHALSHDLVPLGPRTTAGHGFGVLLVVVLVLELLTGLAVAFAMDRSAPSERARRRAGIALLAAIALVPAGVLVAFSTSSRGLTGEVSHLFSKLTNPDSGAPNTPGRLVELGNARGRYWREGLKVGENFVLHGSGALGYATAVTRYTTDSRVVPHAHSYVIETFADFGVIGLALLVAQLAAWGVAAARPLRGPRSSDQRRGTERAGLLTLLAVVVVFGAHSAIDWTWFVPGTAIPALFCAGWLAGRGPLGRPVGRIARREVSVTPRRASAALLVCALAVALAWGAYQPLRSADAQAAAIAALGHGDLRTAATDARAAAAADPVAAEPLWQLATVYDAAGDPASARAQLLRAVERQPQNPRTWFELGQFYLHHRQPEAALAPLRRAHALDLGSGGISQALAGAAAQAAASGSRSTRNSGSLP